MTTVGILNLKLDGVLISSYFSDKVYAVYSTGALELPLIGLFTASITAAIMPNMVAETDRGRPTKSLEIWHKANRKSSLFIFPTFAFFLICGYDFIVFMYTKDYAMATWPFLIYLAKMPIRVAIYGALFRAMGHTKPLALAVFYSFIANVIIGVILLVVGRHGFLSFVGPSIGSLIASFVAVGYLLNAMCVKLNIPLTQAMRWKELGRIFALSLLCGLFLWLIPMPIENLFIKLAIRFVLYVIMFTFSLLLTKSLHQDELELLRLPITLFRKVVFPCSNNTRSSC
jgi:O-antigen/teichoic acid export membrane protein